MKTHLPSIYDSFREELEALKEKQQFRILRTLFDRDLTEVTFQNDRYLNLSSNDYLGLGANRALHREFFDQLSDATLIDRFGMTSSSSRLLTGNHHLYTELEQELADLYQAEAATVLNSGYHANIGILPALASRQDLVLSDKLNHASIIDGLKLTNAKFIRYRHCDYEHLEYLLKINADRYRRIFIVTESVFSMDGDIADLLRLVELKQQYQAMLLVDEAHAVGVFGKRGCGVCEEQGILPEVDIVVGTFGKALASCGAFAITNQLVKDYLVNKMRSLIFTTGLPPIIVNWNRFMLQKVTGMEAQRWQVRELAKRFRKELLAYNLKTCGESPIVPVIIGDNQATVDVAESLQHQGFLVFAIRPPTVPPNSARLRVSLNPEIFWEQISGLPKMIGDRLHEMSVDRSA